MRFFWHNRCMARPTKLPEWATGGSALVTEPNQAKKELGWTAAEDPPPGYFNWYQELVHDWVAHTKAVFDDLFAKSATILSPNSSSISASSGIEGFKGDHTHHVGASGIFWGCNQIGVGDFLYYADPGLGDIIEVSAGTHDAKTAIIEWDDKVFMVDQDIGNSCSITVASSIADAKAGTFTPQTITAFGTGQGLFVRNCGSTLFAFQSAGTSVVKSTGGSFSDTTTSLPGVMNWIHFDGTNYVGALAAGGVEYVDDMDTGTWASATISAQNGSDEIERINEGAIAGGTSQLYGIGLASDYLNVWSSSDNGENWTSVGSTSLDTAIGAGSYTYLCSGLAAGQLFALVHNSSNVWLCLSDNGVDWTFNQLPESLGTNLSAAYHPGNRSFVYAVDDDSDFGVYWSRVAPDLSL